MALQKFDPSGSGPSVSKRPLSFSCKVHEKSRHVEPETSNTLEPDVDIDLREVYFLIMHFLSAGPCHRTYGQFWNELLEHQLLPRRYHAWYSRTGVRSGDENDDGKSFPLSYNMLVERYPHIRKDHLVKLLKQLLQNSTSKSCGTSAGFASHAGAVPTLLGEGSFSLLSRDWVKGSSEVKRPPVHLRWPHIRSDQVRGLGLREIGGGFARHHRAPSIRAASYAIAKPSTMVQKMQNIKRLRGHRNAVYCATFDRSGRYVITGSDDRLVKIWSMETAYCLASCRGHEGDVTDLAVSSNNAMVASSSNDYIIRVWRLPDGLPISILRGHTAAVTAIAFNPRPSSVYHLLSSADDGTCRIWDARNSQLAPRIYIPRPLDSVAGRNSGPSSNATHQNHQIFCCAFNANGTIFVTGSSDTRARVWNACKPNANDSDQPIHEIDVLSGHGNDVNYVQFSDCTVAARFFTSDSPKDESAPKFKNTWYSHENIVTCSRDGSAIIWIPRSRRSHGKVGRWTRAYHLKVPPAPMPSQPPRGGPRMRYLPPPRGVNMIMWSLDNRFVLAAIMDCRICVWNASDGSLVHSLTGHTKSTYVLDVHPFNPRIAMSAGYDGKTIVWDIWEGIPIKTYEISHFKLVDGKFSPDGTSIILSDDVGQLYILSTGQGESQNDAKYDQFFLGDYRPLIRDSYGNVLDQESQLAPYRRNMQDLLCDSAMIPYEEPYQSMFQRRRLGNLGIEWRPTSLRFAVGPDLNLDEDHHILPLADLDALIDPLPEFVDVIDWEPENEVQSDENDSEYNIAEEFSSEGGQGSLSSNSYGESDGREEDSEDEDTNMDGLRRSKRKKERADIEIMTFSGRRVKRRNMDVCEASSSRSRKSRNGRKAAKKSSKSKSARPRRAAARNALSLFSKISGTSDGEDEDEDEDSAEGDTSESESLPQGLNMESEDSDEYLEDEQCKNLKGKDVIVDKTDAVETSEAVESHPDAGNRRKLVLKLPVRASSKLLPSDKAMHNDGKGKELIGSTSKEKGKELMGSTSKDKGKELLGSTSKGPPRGSETSEDHQHSVDSGNPGDLNSSSMETGNVEPVKVEDFVLLDKCRKANLRWGGFKARSTKRARLGDTKSVEMFDRPSMWHDTQKDLNSCFKGSQNANSDCGMGSSHVEIHSNGENMDGFMLMNDKFYEDKVADTSAAAIKSVPDECRVHDSLELVENTLEYTTTSAANNEDRSDHLSELKKSPAAISVKFRIPSISTSTESSIPSKLKQLSSVENQGKKKCIDERRTEQITSVGSPHKIDKMSKDHGNNISQESDGKITGESCPAVDEVPEASQQPERMYAAVYKRSKTRKGRTRSGGDSANTGGETSKASNSNVTTGGNTHRTLYNGNCETSNMPKLAKGDIDSLRSSEQQEELEKTCVGAQTSSRSRSQLQHEEGGSSSRLAVGFRSTRSRRVSCYVRDRSPVENKVAHSAKKSSWLMLSVLEEGFLYVPQKGDEVAYLRQGHEGYINHSHSREEGPWISLKEDINAVEFCKVEDLEYSTLPGSGDSCCKIKLKFIDPSSHVFNQSFSLILPEVTTFPDFLVEKSRFDAAMQKNWVCRDKCEVWWKNDSQGGDWWSGRIVAVKPVSANFPDSPWEKYSILYSNYSNPTEVCLHSPWELRDADHHWVQPQIEAESRNKLLAAFTKLHQSDGSQDRYGVQKLKQVSHRTNFINRFPVPLTLELIQSRLENNYYRSLDALEHDLSVVLSNGESYFERNAEILHKIRRLRELFNRVLSSL